MKLFEEACGALGSAACEAILVALRSVGPETQAAGAFLGRPIKAPAAAPFVPCLLPGGWQALEVLSFILYNGIISRCPTCSQAGGLEKQSPPPTPHLLLGGCPAFAHRHSRGMSSKESGTGVGVGQLGLGWPAQQMPDRGPVGCGSFASADLPPVSGAAAEDVPPADSGTAEV